MKPRMHPENWYSVRRLDDDVTYICEPHIQEFYRCNIWHVRGRDRDMLIDSGMGVVSLREWVPLVTERDLIAVASHTHFDHIGCHHEFECRAVHSAEADLLANPTRENTLAEPYVSDDIFDALPPEPYCSKCYSVKRAPATRLLEGGDIIDLGDRQFEVIHTPGHSPGGIALYEKATEILFSGDLLYDGPLIEDAYHSNASDYYASMESLLRLKVRLVHGGHYPSFSGERYRELITDWLKAKQKTK
ncbi:glyoxylase-like metal-dependent hydrolase (beta-lactamase superfamily II) [Peteryoungia aggregata LMG 23059]|uniref:Glyoxylase-like metal-dependent hydrolase (Beta-lactamase superfamily II) n=1 Tax=Peteryoungia aggregata LMG 23059 TaxID=1368425 RepID=A0ABU0G2U2_9HYPH|nr:MBL fold metallo-hydrolase [Peteryoungia aggregata]MDQ0419655.1 glyoxylase-like metal-dependent hydrolase (beta-lactamase superfamily II) [Peteryoungia aggregata LMG 23059]